MLENLLSKCYDEEFPTTGDSVSVKTAVLSRIENENQMKHFKIKPLIIASVAAVAAAVSIITVNAARNDGLTVKEPTKQEYVYEKGEIHHFNQPYNENKKPDSTATINDFSTEGMILTDESETTEDGLWIINKVFVEDLSDGSDSSVKTQRIIGQKDVYNDNGEHYFTIFLTGTFESNGESTAVFVGGNYFAETENAGEVNYEYGDSSMGSNIGRNSGCGYVEYSPVVKLDGNDRERRFQIRIEVDSSGNIRD